MLWLKTGQQCLFRPFKRARHHIHIYTIIKVGFLKKNILCHFSIWTLKSVHSLLPIKTICLSGLLISSSLLWPLSSPTKAPAAVTRLRFHLVPGQMDREEQRWGTDAYLCGFTSLSPCLYLYFFLALKRHTSTLHRHTHVCEMFLVGLIWHLIRAPG